MGVLSGSTVSAIYSILEGMQKSCSHTGDRTRAANVKGWNPNHMWDHVQTSYLSLLSSVSSFAQQDFILNYHYSYIQLIFSLSDFGVPCQTKIKQMSDFSHIHYD